MKKAYVIGLHGCCVRDMMQAMASEGIRGLELVPLLSVDDVPTDEMVAGDLVLNIEAHKTKTFSERADELIMEIRSSDDTYDELDRKRKKKIERRLNREFRSKKDRRFHK